MKIIPDFIWEKMKKEIPEKQSKIGRPPMDDYRAMSGIFYVLKSGIQWKLLPEEFGKPSTVHGKFMKWAREGVFDRVMKCASTDYLNNCTQLPNRYFLM